MSQREEYMRENKCWGPIEAKILGKDRSLLIGNYLLLFKVTRRGSTVVPQAQEMITFALDISAQKRAEEAALAAVRAKSFFIANISHGKNEDLKGSHLDQKSELL